MKKMRLARLFALSFLLVFTAASDFEEAVYSDVETDGQEIRVRVRRAANTSPALNALNTSTSTPMPMTTTKPTPPTTTEPTITYYEKHTYYHATYMLDDDIVRGYKLVFDSLFRRYKTSVTLSDAHRRALQIRLSFNFMFYGHTDIRRVTIATGGFLYLSDYLHKYLTFSQYIAPLMTDFDTSIGSGRIAYADTGDAFFVRWEKVHIKNQANLGNFTFEAILQKNGTIIFIYEHIPVALDKIDSKIHSLKVGLSDAYYQDRDIQRGYFTRYIIKYNDVSLIQKQVASNVIIILRPLPTCVEQASCSKCLNAFTSFDCNWCSAVSRCSSGTDRLKQEWEKSGCHRIEKAKDCPNPIKAGVVFLIVLIVLILIASIAGFITWIWYAYKHPTSRSGIFLMEHRPSVLAARFSNWRRGGSNQQASDVYRVDNSTC